MVKVSAPAMSLDASGSLAGTLVFSKWKGRNYVRQLVIPANPRYPKMVSVREMFKFLSQRWKPDLSDASQATWDDRADDMIVSPFNAYMSYNQKRWKNFIGPSHDDPATAAGAQPSCEVGTSVGGVRMVTLTTRSDTPNDGWGFLWFRATNDGFDTAFDNLVSIHRINPGLEVHTVDTPLDAGTYYYNLRPFTDDGLIGAERGQTTATVT